MKSLVRSNQNSVSSPLPTLTSKIDENFMSISPNSSTIFTTFCQQPWIDFLYKEVIGFLARLWVPQITWCQKPFFSSLNLHIRLTKRAQFKALIDPIPSPPLAMTPKTSFHATRWILFFSLLPPHKNLLLNFSIKEMTEPGALKWKYSEVGDYLKPINKSHFSAEGTTENYACVLGLLTYNLYLIYSKNIY